MKCNGGKGKILLRFQFRYDAMSTGSDLREEPEKFILILAYTCLYLLNFGPGLLEREANQRAFPMPIALITFCLKHLKE